MSSWPRLHGFSARLVPWLILLATIGAAPAKDDDNPSLPPAVSDDLTAHAAALFEAIKTGRPDLAEPFFFPREPFLVLKDVDDPAHYYKDLVSAYRHNIKDLHAQRRNWDRATLKGLTLAETPRRIPPGREWNKIGYFRTRHARLEYEVEGHPRFIEVHTIISWDGQWYVTHLSAIRH
jgi:hypothetical protein